MERYWRKDQQCSWTSIRAPVLPTVVVSIDIGAFDIPICVLVRAYLLETAINIITGPPEKRVLMTGESPSCRVFIVYQK